MAIGSQGAVSSHSVAAFMGLGFEIFQPEWHIG
jgi:hypothetical protein